MINVIERNMEKSLLTGDTVEVIKIKDKQPIYYDPQSGLVIENVEISGTE